MKKPPADRSPGEARAFKIGYWLLVIGPVVAVGIWVAILLR